MVLYQGARTETGQLRGTVALKVVWPKFAQRNVTQPSDQVLGPLSVSFKRPWAGMGLGVLS